MERPDSPWAWFRPNSTTFKPNDLYTEDGGGGRGGEGAHSALYHKKIYADSQRRKLGPIFWPSFVDKYPAKNLGLMQNL
jgi:hypothetical protein